MRNVSAEPRAGSPSWTTICPSFLASYLSIVATTDQRANWISANVASIQVNGVLAHGWGGSRRSFTSSLGVMSRARSISKLCTGDQIVAARGLGGSLVGVDRGSLGY